ncbi:hypothetical protein [Lysinibacillus sp. RC79]|uniref:hypothetical protein n=1 Tax=Lysinibacillus sp. RC79 TaxID=3156296 RepID=UPI00351352AF
MNLIVEDEMNNINYAIVSIAYVVIVCFAQVFFYDSILLQLLIFPFVIVPIYIFFLLIKFKLEFHKYLLSIYLGFFCSVIISSFIILFPSPSKELPPGEIFLGADVIFIFWTSTIQFSILSLLTVVLYLFHRLFKKRYKG